MKKLFTIILIIFLPFYILLTLVEVNTFNKDFYLKSYETYGVLDVTGKNLEELDNVTEDLLSYLKDDSLDEELLSPHFNDKEIKHMEDVKVLFKYGFIIKKLSLVLSVLSIVYLLIHGGVRNLIKIIFYGNFIWIGIIILLFLLTTIDFNKYFTYFHLIFFNNDLWLLDPKTDLLIQILPEQFFISIFKRIVLLFMLVLATIQIISFIIIKKRKDNYGGYIRI